MAAQVAEEIAGQVQRLPGKQRPQRIEQRLLARRGRYVVFARRPRLRVQIARPQGLAVDLARGQARHLDHPFKAGGNHVRGQLARQGRAQGVQIQPRLALGSQEGNQLLDACQIAQHHGGCAHARLAVQRRLDLAQLDAKAPHLHLVVAATQAMDLTVLVDARQVAAAIHARIVVATGPGIGQEFFGGKLGPAQIAVGHARARDAQFAHLPHRQYRAIFTTHQHAVVG